MAVLPPEMDADFDRVPVLAEMGRSLARYAIEIARNSAHFELSSSGRWIVRPTNFVAFKIQPRTKSIAITVRGGPAYFEIHPDVKRVARPALGLKADLGDGSYSIFRLRSAAQLGEASIVIAQALQCVAERGNIARRT